MLARIGHNRIWESDAIDHGAFNRGGDAERVDSAGEFDHLRKLVADVRLVSYAVVLRDKRRGADKKLELAVVCSKVTVAVDGGEVIGYGATEFRFPAQEDPFRGHEHIVEDGQRFDDCAA